MIRKLTLENFHGFNKRTEIEFAPLTLIFGPNSSGKSSIIKSILLIKQALKRPLENAEVNFVDKEVDLGNFLTTVFGHLALRDMSLGFSLSTKNTNTAFELKISDPGLVKAIEISNARKPTNPKSDSKNGRPDASSDLDDLGQSDLPFKIRFSETSAGSRKFKISHASPQDLRNLLQVSVNFRLPGMELSRGDQYRPGLAKALREMIWTLTPDFKLIPDDSFETKIRELNLKDSKNESKKDTNKRDSLFMQPYIMQHHLMMKVNNPRMALVRLIENTSHIAGLRHIPKRFSAIGNNDGLEADGSNISEVLAANPKSIQLASKWLYKVTNKAYALKYVSVSTKAEGIYSNIGALILEDKLTGTETTFQDVGLGLSQVLPILTALAQYQTAKQVTKKKSPLHDALLLLEQPELHLHPQMQSDLMDIIVSESLAMNPLGPQVVMETHSENMILRVQKLIRTGKISNKDVSVIYVNRKAKSTGTKVLKLNLSDDGEFVEPWPLGFADVRLSEIFD